MLLGEVLKFNKAIIDKIKNTNAMPGEVLSKTPSRMPFAKICLILFDSRNKFRK
jgi:hypothetical protein